jgi:hypothetical protein
VEPPDPSPLGLVLSGGGAHGAYEVEMLRHPLGALRSASDFRF